MKNHLTRLRSLRLFRQVSRGMTPRALRLEVMAWEEAASAAVIGRSGPPGMTGASAGAAGAATLATSAVTARGATLLVAQPPRTRTVSARTMACKIFIGARFSMAPGEAQLT